MIPADDLAAAGLRPVLVTTPAMPEVDPDDLYSLRLALAHHEALGLAREAHLADLRSEIRRLHDRLAEALAKRSHDERLSGPHDRTPTATAPT